MTDISNYDRALAAEVALEAHVSELDPGAIEGDLAETIVDLLANLMHLCAIERLDFEEKLATARGHFEAETDPRTEMKGGAFLSREAAQEIVDEYKNCPDCGNMIYTGEDHDCPAEQHRLARAAMGLDPDLDIPPFLKRGK